ncbi:HAD family hydrolase [Mesorhizobium sp. 2RAF21]|uniref:HAD family hydrolase n=1 Tax=Mesorhizobium sp. 2RAF21 TaxID=3232995 RepID=UPI003F9BF758
MQWIKAITFDFWGTLVDVDTSGEVAMAHLLDNVGLIGINPRELYLRWDAATVRRYRSDKWRPYVEWTAFGIRDVLEPLGIELNEAQALREAETFVSKMTTSAKPHAEVPHVIAALRSRWPLMPITNMDDRFFQLNPFTAEFDLYLTAEQAGAFKPSAIIFGKAIERLNVDAENILHVSLSQFADLEGAMPLGIKVAWINRGREKRGQFTPQPLFEFADLNELASVLSL